MTTLTLISLRTASRLVDMIETTLGTWCRKGYVTAAKRGTAGRGGMAMFRPQTVLGIAYAAAFMKHMGRITPDYIRVIVGMMERATDRQVVELAYGIPHQHDAYKEEEIAVVKATAIPFPPAMSQDMQRRVDAVLAHLKQVLDAEEEIAAVQTARDEFLKAQEHQKHQEHSSP